MDSGSSDVGTFENIYWKQLQLGSKLTISLMSLEDVYARANSNTVYTHIYSLYSRIP